MRVLVLMVLLGHLAVMATPVQAAMDHSAAMGQASAAPPDPPMTCSVGPAVVTSASSVQPLLAVVAVLPLDVLSVLGVPVAITAHGISPPPLVIDQAILQVFRN